MQEEEKFATILESQEYRSDPHTLYSMVEGVAYTWTPTPTPTNTVVLVLTAVVALSYLWVTRLWPSSFECMRDPRCPLSLPPGTMGYPFIGETLEFARKGDKFFTSRLARYGPAFKTHLLGCPTVRLVGKDNIKPVLLGEHSTVRSYWPWSIRKLLGPRSLLSMGGNEHRSMKQHLASLLSPTVLASFVPRMQALIDLHLDRWCQHSETHGQMLAFPACRQLSLDLGLETMLGIGPDRADRESLCDAMKELVANMFSLPIIFPGSGVWKGLRARERILRAVRQKLDTSGTRQDVNFLSLVELMQLTPEFHGKRRVIEDISIELVFAGYSTTASAFCNALLCVGRNPDVLKNLESEILEEGLLDDPTAELTYDVIGRLQYVHNVNREVLRLYPSAGAGFRKVIKTLKIGDYQIPKDWTVVYSIRETQHTADLYHDSDQFLPERWEDLASEEMKEKLRYQYLPFGMAARACLGRQLAKLYQAVFLVELVRRCRFRLHNPSPVIKFIPVAKPADDLPATFSRCDSASQSLKPCGS